MEKKRSDVNLACHLLLDAFHNNFDVAAVLSNDSELVEPIRIVTQVLGKPVGLLSPHADPAKEVCNRPQLWSGIGNGAILEYRNFRTRSFARTAHS